MAAKARFGGTAGSWWAVPATRPGPLQTAADPQRSLVEVDVRPVQAHRLRPAKAQHEHGDPQPVEPVVSRSVQELARFIGRERLDRGDLLGDLDANAPSDIASHQVLGERMLERCAQCRVHPLDHARAHPGIAHVVDHDPYIADGQPVQLFSPDAGHKV